MNDFSGEVAALHDPVEAIRAALDEGRENSARLGDASERLTEIAGSAEDASHLELAQLVVTLASLLEIASCAMDSQDPEAEPHEFIDFVLHSLPMLNSALDDADDVNIALQERTEEAHSKWGECLQLVMDGSPSGEPWDSTPDMAVEDNEDDLEDVSLGTEQIGLILNSLVGQPEEPQPDEVSSESDNEAVESEPPAEVFESNQEPSSSDEPPDLDQVSMDKEMLEAYLDDAQRCLASIESALLTYENNPSNHQPLEQVCRELHTLKGASASVGLNKVASFLHTVEDNLQESVGQEGPNDVEPILNCVDLVRRQIELLSCNEPGGASPPSASSAEPVSADSRSRPFVDTSAPSQDSVRVKSAQLDRLMDMLAELVMLRNRRESRVEQLKSINSELVHCVSRLRAYEEGCPATSSIAAMVEAVESKPSAKRSGRQPVSSLTEIANDLLDLGRNLRELYEPFGDENLDISRFIRQFRQELMQLRRVPIGGLFKRLQRATRDAARTENKQVRMQLIGAEVGLERSVQDQLYDALLHIVRNAVSHGIESESDRLAQGKSPAGTVILEARGGSNMMVITVRDDGKGLDYDAIRRRGVEMGLISIDRAASRSELARLIFHPGFSTRSEATELSGRGVGMDVVATTLDRLHSWVEVESVSGEGTTIRLLIPLHSVIEHAMVFRAANQDFAVPTQFVKAAGPWDPNEAVDFPIIPVSALCPGIHTDQVAQPELLVIAHGWEAGKEIDANSDGHGDESHSGRRLGLLVDEIVGPEEVVVRPLPGLIKNQRLFAGVSLSGTGDIMLLFDSQRMMDSGLQLSKNPQAIVMPEYRAKRSTGRILVVDDSRSSRRVLSQLLARLDLATDEAADGFEALRMIRQHSYDIVFTDLEMPQMSGFELVREIKSTDSTAHIPVIMVSSRDEDVFQQKARKLGVIEYLTKPVSEKTLKETMHRLKEPQ